MIQLQIKAILTADVSWQTYFNCILPGMYKKVHVVNSNTCNQVFTMNIKGSHDDYVGIGNHHNAKYDKCDIFELFTTFQKHLGRD